jgi:hypothetical protein
VPPEIHWYIKVACGIFHKIVASMQISEASYKIMVSYLTMPPSEYNRLPDPSNVLPIYWAMNDLETL